MTTRTGLCIGGPLDGQRLTWGNACYEIVEMPPLPVLIPEQLEHITKQVVAITTYVQMHLGAPADIVTVWHPMDQSPGDTARKLVQAYAEQAKARK